MAIHKKRINSLLRDDARFAHLTHPQRSNEFIRLLLNNVNAPELFFGWRDPDAAEPVWLRRDWESV